MVMQNAHINVVFNRAVASQMTIKRKSKADFISWQLAKLFRSDVFGFPELTLFLWQWESRRVWGATTPCWQHTVAFFSYLLSD
jgi:hypothetical protein